MTTLTANEIFRDFNTDGVPASGAFKPIKAEIREYLTERVEQAIGGGTVFVPTIAALKAVATATLTNVYVTDPLRAGLFSFRAGDYGGRVDADTAEGIYVEANDTDKTDGAWVRQYSGVPQAAWFGADPDGVDSANTIAFNAAATMIATLGMSAFLALSPGAYASTNSAFDLTQVVLTGPGKIEMDGFLQAPNRSLMTVDPGDASDSRYELFDGLTEETQQQSYMFVGPAVGSVTGAIYRTITAAAREVSVYDFVGGFNTDPGDHTLGRSGVFEELHRVYHGGQGDLTQRQIYGEVYSARSGATHFLANPAIGIENGGVAASGAATGAYLQLTEHIINDNGLAVAAVARVTNFIRTNAGAALGQVWVHDRPQSGGSVSIDAVYTPAGAWKRGLDFTPTTLDADKAAVVLKSSDRIYFNATSTADALGIKWFATSLGSIYIDSDGTSLRSSVGLTPVANDGAALGASGAAWSDGFFASGAVFNWNAGNVTLTHSADNLSLAANGFNVTSATAFSPQVVNRNSTNDANGAYFIVRKSRGVANTAVSVSDTLGTFLFQGYDSTGTPALRTGGYLTATVESVSAGAMAARFELVAGSSIWQFKTDNHMITPGMIKITGDTSGAPALKASGAVLQARLADDSAFANFSAAIINAAAGTATPASGSTAARLLFGTTAGFGIYYGSGVPTVSAAQGSIYLRSDGSTTATRLYVNTNGTTGWTNFTSAT